MVRDASVRPYSLGGRGGRTSVANDCGGANAANRSAALAGEENYIGSHRPIKHPFALLSTCIGVLTGMYITLWINSSY